MSRRAIKTDEIPIDQKTTVNLDKASPKDRVSDIVIADRPLDKDYAAALAFMEEPVRIRIEPSSDQNAPGAHRCAVNGKGAEILINGKWLEATWLSVGVEYTVKRKYVEVLLRAKTDTVRTEIVDPQAERPQNNVHRVTSRLATFSILHDPNPKGPAWVQEVVRRQY
jgi:hypothetical protein